MYSLGTCGQVFRRRPRVLFQRLIWKESQFEDIRLSEDYRLEVIDRWGLPARPELSAGERQVLSLSFNYRHVESYWGGSALGDGHAFWTAQQRPQGGDN